MGLSSGRIWYNESAANPPKEAAHLLSLCVCGCKWKCPLSEAYLRSTPHLQPPPFSGIMSSGVRSHVLPMPIEYGIAADLQAAHITPREERDPL